MEFKTVELNLDFQVWLKTVRFWGLKLKIKLRKIRKELLEVSGHWVRVFRATNMSSGLFPRVGEHDI